MIKKAGWIKLWQLLFVIPSSNLIVRKMKRMRPIMQGITLEKLRRTIVHAIVTHVSTIQMAQWSWWSDLDNLSTRRVIGSSRVIG